MPKSKKISSIRIVDNSDIFKNAAAEAIQRALEAIGLEAEKNAVNIADEKGVHDTGLLINSITHAIDGGKTAISTYSDDKGEQTRIYQGVAPKTRVPTVYIGSGVEYAVVNETGGHGHRARPFLKPAIEDFKDDYKQILKEELEKG